jgi:hypothetical protein
VGALKTIDSTTCSSAGFTSGTLKTIGSLTGVGFESVALAGCEGSALFKTLADENNGIELAMERLAERKGLLPRESI